MSIIISENEFSNMERLHITDIFWSEVKKLMLHLLELLQQLEKLKAS